MTAVWGQKNELFYCTNPSLHKL